MLVCQAEQYVRTHFASEAELEDVVRRYAQQLFGNSILYLPQTRVTTVGGRGSTPDAVVIDIEEEVWYIVEAERAVHGTWEHIAPQVSRQLAAVASPDTLAGILRTGLEMIRADPRLNDMFRELDIGDLEIHGRVHRILQKPPVIAIPIDALPKDLKDWVATLRNEVKVWVIEKYVSTIDVSRVLYSLPDENFPTLATRDGIGDAAISKVRAAGSQPYLELIDAMPALVGEQVYLDYRPRGGTRRRFEAVLAKDGVQVDGDTYSLSYGALQCLRAAGSDRTTANGWYYWRTGSGERLSEVYRRVVSSSP
jgi:hypothetical protein